MKSALKLSSLFLALVMLSCAASRSAPAEPWSIVIATSGGFTGRGMGTFSVDSDGKVTMPRSGKVCTFSLKDDELRHIASLLAKARPKEWKASYVPENPCCDRYEYRLTVDEAGEKTTTKWIDAPLPMPPDLVAISDAIIGGGPESLRMQPAERCQ